MDKVYDQTKSRLGPNVHPVSLCTQVINPWSKGLYTASYKHITENMQRILIMPNIYKYDTLYLTSKSLLQMSFRAYNSNSDGKPSLFSGI